MTKRRNIIVHIATQRRTSDRELVIRVVPVFIGDGIPLIARRHRHVPLDLRDVERFEDGVVQLRYRVQTHA